MKTPSSLITLGTGGGPSLTPHRAQTSHLLTVNGNYYVVDAGDGVARRMARAGADVRKVGIIFLTHHHDDHTAGLATLMALAWDGQRTEPINVYGPPRTTGAGGRHGSVLQHQRRHPHRRRRPQRPAGQGVLRP